ncbi:hypothetical protein [Halalkalibacterium halodurans]|uniref:hypothetical protein n=1 Tax=Halalkalibacterium halodurans TaxID=86665 RepID=UPI001F3138E2|nr:hypothetical protein [Halalkalibacterium halodurans]MDY7222074.1 hypothetical protein [Halalkalibacterium halodurans]MDY7243907.1 hypothetical protein [Halalkalibacterium halodurans]
MLWQLGQIDSQLSGSNSSSGILTPWLDVVHSVGYGEYATPIAGLTGVVVTT